MYRGSPKRSRSGAHATANGNVTASEASRGHSQVSPATSPVTSYRHFARLRRDGVVPAGLRFQVCLPMTGSGCDTFFRDPADVTRVHAAYEEAMIREIRGPTTAGR